MARYAFLTTRVARVGIVLVHDLVPELALRLGGQDVHKIAHGRRLSRQLATASVGRGTLGSPPSQCGKPSVLAKRTRLMSDVTK